MKIKIGTFEKSIVNCNVNIQPSFEGGDVERVSVDFEDTLPGARELTEAITAEFNGNFEILDGNSTETFSSFMIEEIRKNYRETGRTLTASFVSRGNGQEE